MAGDVEGDNALMMAVAQNHADIVRKLLDASSSVDPDVQNKIGQTALMKAASKRNMDCVRMLLDAGANLNTKSKGGKTALVEAAEKNNLEVAQVLLFPAAFRCDEPMLQLLLSSRADAAAKAERIGTALMMALMKAVEEGNAAAVQALLDAKANAAAKNQDARSSLQEGKTALDLAKRSGNASLEQSDAKSKRMQVMLENSDVEFQVGPEGERFYGLKAIFARASEVFSKMFFEAGFREQHEATPRVVVRIEDIMPGPFQLLHRWVYDMDVSLSCDTIFGVLDAARKYMVEDLELTCRRWLALEARSSSGAVGLFCAAVAGQWIPWSQALRSRVESFGATALAASPKAIGHLPADAFMSLLSSEDLCVEREEEVFEAVQAWADAANDRGEDPAAVRGLDGESRDWRFFTERVVLLGRLTQEQSLSVFVSRAMGDCPARQASLLARLQLILRDCSYEDATSIIDSIIDLRHEDTYPRTLAHCLVQKALADYEHCSEWVSMWTELWGALRAAGLRDECVRATVDYCQNLFEEEPSLENLVGVWICPYDTLGLVRVLCKLNDSRKLAVLPLMKVLEALVRKAEESAPQGGSTCCPAAAARELATHLEKIRSRSGHLVALQSLPSLQQRLEDLPETGS
ncbi:unnamed protein product [Effrenium voratum]|nr:unnamed protein product [Effrenium voratum]